MLMIIFGLLGLMISFYKYREWSYSFCGYLLLCVTIGSKGYVEGMFYFLCGEGLMCDLLSWSLVYLTFWISSLMILASTMIFNFNSYSREFLLAVGALTLFLILVFMVSDLLWFYIFFEGSLIPTLFLISGWGYQPERLKAGIYLFFYTMFGSLPLLLGILFLGSSFFSTSFHLYLFEENMNLLLCFVMMFAFLVKMPMFFVHLWLPKAHVEAPISGSMVLAGILLKLGGYGLLRVSILFTSSIVFIGSGFIIISLVGGSLISLLCLRQFDMKSLIAYSSVVHMGLALGGLMVLSTWGHQGVMALMIGHGLCSSGLFVCANILYERGGTRSTLMNKGLISVFPSMMLWWFLLCVCNMAAPPSLNLLGEISLLISIISWSVNMGILLALVSFLSAAYTLYLFSLVNHGRVSTYYGFSDIKLREFLLLVLHWIPLNFFILKGDLAFYWLLFMH